MDRAGADAEGPWRFALAVYGRPGAAPACLDLQNRRGADVVLVLFALWAGAACATRLDPGRLSALRSLAGPWAAEVVEPLRTVRRRLKEGPPPAPGAASAALRRRLQEIEIEAERIELDALHQRCPLDRAARPDGDAARANLEALCAPHADADRAAIDLLVEAALAAAQEGAA
ncbi:TIGR02444 family protein [Arenibaculum sp.]|jgi:uncharacterized protein (TIGR02444 family)|uniref:TIGR02444 family protein n=1 Tax=Arenibaculum sp. TaxID=2865862 RepID=UPI002E11BBD0|nr:TIGR02444 family protein [Arenibaculum sp.]